MADAFVMMFHCIICMVCARLMGWLSYECNGEGWLLLVAMHFVGVD